MREVSCTWAAGRELVIEVCLLLGVRYVYIFARNQYPVNLD